MQIIEDFLLSNGFIKTAENKFKTRDCEVIIHADIYQVKFLNEQTGSMYSNDKNIYWLIGLLTYNELIDKNYNIKK